MALNVGPDFKHRWLNVPDAVRQAFIDDLSRVCDVLLPETQIQTWLEYDRRQQQRSFDKIDVAYAQRKAELIEAARVRKQQALEQALQAKRAEEQAYAEALKQDEERQFAVQTQILYQMTDVLALETNQHINRYAKNPPVLSAVGFPLQDGQMRSELENVRIRLELEAEIAIEESLSALRKKLKQAAQEEIEYMLLNSNFEQSVEEGPTPS